MVVVVLFTIPAVMLPIRDRLEWLLLLLFYLGPSSNFTDQGQTRIIVVVVVVLFTSQQ